MVEDDDNDAATAAENTHGGKKAWFITLNFPTLSEQLERLLFRVKIPHYKITPLTLPGLTTTQI